MRVRVFQHVAFEGLGSIGPWLAARRAEVCWTRFHAGDEPPVEQDSDLLIVLGGPMSVHDEVVLEVASSVSLEEVCRLMAETPPWVKGLLLRADGYVCPFYKKD